MGQNLKDLFKNQPHDESVKMSQGHEARFLEKLDKALPQKKKSNHFGFLNIAARKFQSGIRFRFLVII